VPELPYEAVHLDEVETVVEFGEVPFKALRRRLGIEASRVAAYVVSPGKPVVLEHDEGGEEGQQELYVVLAGSAEFTILASRAASAPRSGAARCSAARPGSPCPRPRSAGSMECDRDPRRRRPAP
jgi:hypothetical protein